MNLGAGKNRWLPCLMNFNLLLAWQMPLLLRWEDQIRFMEQPEIKYFDRHLGKIRSEKVYGDKWLKRIYGNPLGNLTLWCMVKRLWFSRWYGKRMDAKSSRDRIKPFIRNFELQEEEFLEPAENFRTFNEFFYRKLKPESRPIASSATEAIFPADGRHLGFQKLDDLDGVFVKGQTFDLPRLFGSKEKAASFEGGSLVLSRLCPVDYHRFHFTAAGMASNPELIQGCLSSVNPIALRLKLAILWENKRNLSFIDSEHFGRIACFEIGATCVGSMNYTKSLPGKVAKGDEKGFFSFGGSSLITLFQPGRIALAEDLLEHSSHQREVYAKMGSSMGSKSA